MKSQITENEPRMAQVKQTGRAETMAAEPKPVPAGDGIREALRRQADRAGAVALSADFEDEVMNRVEAVSRSRRHDWRFRRMAAIWVAVCLMGGLSYAAYHAVKGRWFAAEPAVAPEPAAQAVPTPQDGKGQTVRFVNQPLDSILATVAAHYGRAVAFTGEAPRTQRLLISWDKAAPLSDFVEALNELDGLHVSDERDTLFVSPGDGEGEADE